MSTLTVQPEEKAELLRPLSTLIVVVKTGLQQGIEGYRLAGEALWEAKAQVARGKWGKWLRQNFSLSMRSAQNYMSLASNLQIKAAQNEINAARAAHSQVAQPKTLSAALEPNRQLHHRPAWHEPIREALPNRQIIERLKQERQDKEQEDKLQRQLAFKLIDIGYKVLATKLHPDKGGSREAMARLNKVRDILRGAI
jgi:hypothetical protein